jgi:hypothetical protein
MIDAAVGSGACVVTSAVFRRMCHNANAPLRALPPRGNGRLANRCYIGKHVTCADNDRRLAVEEDEIGLRKALGHVHYVQCSRCGRSVPEGEATMAPADALEEAADFRLLCSACRDELAAGEQELPLTSE